MRICRLAWLVIALLLAQWAAATHAIEHAHGDAGVAEIVCVDCLVLAGLHGAPAAVSPCWSMPPRVFETVAAVPPAPTFAVRRPYDGRAPPDLPS